MITLMLKLSKKIKSKPEESGFITMILMMLLVLSAVIFFAYQNVVGN